LPFGKRRKKGKWGFWDAEGNLGGKRGKQVVGRGEGCVVSRKITAAEPPSVWGEGARLLCARGGGGNKPVVQRALFPN